MAIRTYYDDAADEYVIRDSGSGTTLVRFTDAPGATIPTQYFHNGDYGLRDNSGTMEVKDNGGSWLEIASSGDLHKPQSETRYIIYKEDSTIKAKNGSTGKIDYSGSSADTVIQNAINALPSTGGIIYLTSGTYTISSTIALDNYGQVLQGEGNGTKLVLADGSDTNMVRLQGLNSAVEDLYLDGNKANNASGHGIFLTGNSKTQDFYKTNIVIQNNYIENTVENAIKVGYNRMLFAIRNNYIVTPGNDGIFFTDEGAGTYFARKIIVTGNQIKKPSRAGIYVGYHSVAGWVIISNNAVQGGTYGIYGDWEKYSKGFIIHGNRVGWGVTYGIYARTSWTVQNNRVDSATNYGIKVEGNYVPVTDNTIQDVDQDGIIVNSSNHLIANNRLARTNDTGGSYYSIKIASGGNTDNLIMGNIFGGGSAEDPSTSPVYHIYSADSANTGNTVKGNQYITNGSSGNIGMQANEISLFEQNRPYGIRDNDGTIEVKGNGGIWENTTHRAIRKDESQALTVRVGNFSGGTPSNIEQGMIWIDTSV